MLCLTVIICRIIKSFYALFYDVRSSEYLSLPVCLLWLDQLEVFSKEAFSVSTSNDLGIFPKIPTHTLKILSLGNQCTVRDMNRTCDTEISAYQLLGGSFLWMCTSLVQYWHSFHISVLLAITRLFSPGTVFCSLPRHVICRAASCLFRRNVCLP